MQQNEELDWGDIPRKGKTAKKPTLSEGLQHLQQFGEAIGGGVTGLAQGASDIGANIGHFPSEAYTYFTGKPGYDTPKPDFRDIAPSSKTGQNFEKGGEILAPWLASPTLAAETTLGKTMFGGRMLPRLLADMLGGAAEGETGNRGTSALLGGAAPAIGGAKSWLKKTPFTEFGATKKLEKAKKLAGEESLGIPMDLDFIRNMEYQMNSPQVKPSKMQLNTLLGNAAQGDYPSFNALQSGIDKISRGLVSPSKSDGKGMMAMIQQLLSRPQTTGPERLAADQLNQLRKKYISDAMQHLRNTGKKDIAELSEGGREDYRRYKKFAPKRNALITAGIAGAIPGYRKLKNLVE